MLSSFAAAYRNLGIAGAIWCTCLGVTLHGADNSADQAIRESTREFVEAFNAGKARDLAELFHPQGEYVDEEGNVYRGREEVGKLLGDFFAAFPEAEGTIEIASIRTLTPTLAIEEGSRSVTAANTQAPAFHRYLAVRVLSEGKWRYASYREYDDTPPPTAHDYLRPLAWLEGEWLSEGSEAAVKITYRWSEDGNFLLGEFEIRAAGEVVLKTSQRIGWDPVAGRVRSWLFDSDGGFGEGQWAQVEDAWVIKSVAVLPTGDSGSATITITPVGAHQFRMRGTDRIVGSERVPDFDVEVTRHPPAAAQ
jgi:uncharacterized protein (TIGR02246 family)